MRLRSISASVPILIIISLLCCLPYAIAQQTNITNVQFPKSLLYDLEADSTIPPATITARVNYSEAKPGYYLQVGVFQLDDGSLVKGSASASPENCVQNSSETYAACTVPVRASTGSGDFRFLLHSRPKRLWDLALVAILANSSLGILDDSESDYSFTINVSVALTLQINVPSPVTVNVDGINQSQGSINLTLVNGPHNLTVPEIVPVNSDTRLKFEGWSDGVTSANRTVLVNHYVSLEANFTTQYLLTIESPVPISGLGWYDQGSNATFTVNSKVQGMDGLLGFLGGRWEFRGWYDRDHLITKAETASIQMNSSHLIQARWYANYSIPAGLVISALILLSYAIANRSRRTSELKAMRRQRRKQS